MKKTVCSCGVPFDAHEIGNVRGNLTWICPPQGVATP